MSGLPSLGPDERRPRQRGLLSAILVALIGSWLPGAPPALGQDACVGEREPNDTEADVTATLAPLCLEGTLPPDDQDLVLLEVTRADLATRWRITLEGVPGTLTIAQLYPLASPPGQPVLARSLPILETSVSTDQLEATVMEDVLLPAGQYLLGISRSGLPGGGEPAVFDYGVRIEAGAPFPALVETEPNDDEATATPLTGAFEAGGDLAGSSYDVFAWTVAEGDRRWDLDVLVPLEQTVSLELRTADGRVLGTAGSASGTRLYDLALEAGTYLIRLSPEADAPRPYVVRATPTDVAADPEPNDESTDAVPVVDGTPVSGRLASANDKDRFSLSVPPGTAALRDVRMLWQAEVERTLCILDEADARVTCRRGVGGLVLQNLLLPPGRHTLEVSGLPEPDDLYLMRVDVTSAPAPDFEAEPNDDARHATPLDPALGMRARGAAEDSDYFRMRVEGEPRLWDIELTGSDVRGLAVVRPDGTDLAAASIDADRARAAIADLYLVPGEHLLQARVAGPEYAISATPLGPPDPDGEREPNSEPVRAERYRIGTRRVGRLRDVADADFMRFTIAAPQHVRLDLRPAADAQVGLRLWAGGQAISELRGLPPGEPIAHDVWLQPGDHLIELFAEQASAEAYELTSRRLDPFSLRDDQEPNDLPAFAGPLPPALAWEGEAADPDDEDWYAVPSLGGPGDVRIELEGEGARARLGHWDEQSDFVRYLDLAAADDGSLVAADAPAGVPLLLSIAADGAYRVRLSAPGLTPREPPPPPPISLSWDVESDEVAAHWPEQQVLRGSLGIVNGGPEPVDLRLETVTSHHLWGATPEVAAVSVPAAGRVDVPVTITAGPDAWAGESVQVGVRALTGQAGQVSAVLELSASGEAAPLGSQAGWTVPPALLGGLNMASEALGAVPAGTLDAARERLLYDGVTPDGGGFRVFISDVVERLPLEIEVDLAGEVPLPIVGTVINPQAGAGALRDMPRDFELSLSADGSVWETVLQGRISALPVDQHFVLPEPVLASHARLRIWAKQTGERGGYLELGEWKVIAAPGIPAPGEPVDLAEPVRGGHVVRLLPFRDEEALGPRLLDEDPSRDAVEVGDAGSVEIVLGFQDGRAPWVTGLEWADPGSSQAAERLDRVEVWGSLRSPVGPWQPLGTWELTREPDGRVAPLAFATPTWLRYLRLAGTPPPEARNVELPGALRVLEQPTGEGYRSILAEWGHRSAAGPYEWLGGAEGIDWAQATDAGDSIEAATALAPGVLAIDRAEIGVDEDWYGLVVPAGHNTLEVVVDGRPTVGVRLSLLAEDGTERPMAFQLAEDGSVHFQASVEPGARYALGVRQPPFSAVFAVDTSQSMLPFLDLVNQGLRSFLADVRPGREVISVVPFEEPPLLAEWEDDPYLLQGAFDAHVVEGNGSSAAEVGLIDASELLREREGARAILLVTDAETTSFERTPELWEELAAVRPIVFAVHIGGVEEPVVSRERMQDWAASGGGVYVYPSTAGEMDRAFERMATWLRRPAAYTLMYSTSSVVLEPGMLSVRAPADGSRPGVAPGVGVELILDTSGSMLEPLEGTTRLEIAKSALRSLVADGLEEGVPVALRTFGGKGKKRKARCQTRLTLPLAPLDTAATSARITSLQAKKATKTPIAAALLAVADDLAEVSGPRTVVLVTDGDETCGGDPVAALESLRAGGLEVHVNIVGFALDDEALKTAMSEWAASGGGTYFDAAGAEGLAEAIATAVSAPFRVYGPDGAVLGGGTVGGGPAELEPGTYRVEVLVDPPVTFEEVVVAGGEAVELLLPGPGDEG